MNNSAISALRKIDGFEILRRLFSQNINIPTGVREEFSARFRDLPDFINIIELDNNQKSRADSLNLGLGEREAIVLAEDLNAVLVMEDKKPRAVAKERGVETIGTLGIIRRAFIECLVSRDELEEMVEKLKRDLYFRQWLIDWVLEARKSSSN